MKVEFRLATRGEIDSFYSDYDVTEYTLKAWVGLVDDEVVALGGFRYERGIVVAFMEIRSETARKAKLAIVKAAKAVLVDARKNGYRFVYADMSLEEPTAERFLNHLGFERLVPEMTTFVWRHDR